MVVSERSFASLVLTFCEYVPVTVIVMFESPFTTVEPSATMETVFPLSSTIFAPSSAFNAKRVVSPVTTQVEFASIFTVIGAAVSSALVVSAVAVFASLEAAAVPEL